MIAFGYDNQLLIVVGEYQVAYLWYSMLKEILRDELQLVVDDKILQIGPSSQQIQRISNYIQRSVDNRTFLAENEGQ